MTFNEWMAHIHRELGYPEHKIKIYEQASKSKVLIQADKQRTLSARNPAKSRPNGNHRRVEANQ